MMTNEQAMQLGIKLCKKCHMREANFPHVCPYKAYVFGDAETLCNCCEECHTECKEDG